MHKSFDEWNIQKQKVHFDAQPLDYNEREVWWCALGVNVGNEQDGTSKAFERPVLVVKGVSRNTCYVIPLTTANRTHKYRISVGYIDGRDAQAIISQMCLIDTRRFVNKVCYLNKERFADIQKAVRNMF